LNLLKFKLVSVAQNNHIKKLHRYIQGRCNTLFRIRLYSENNNRRTVIIKDKRFSLIQKNIVSKLMRLKNLEQNRLT
jgi:hypothetical protein